MLFCTFFACLFCTPPIYLPIIASVLRLYPLSCRGQVSDNSTPAHLYGAKNNMQGLFCAVYFFRQPLQTVCGCMFASGYFSSGCLSMGSLPMRLGFTHVHKNGMAGLRVVPYFLRPGSPDVRHFMPVQRKASAAIWAPSITYEP